MKIYVIICWIISIGTLFAIVFGQHNIQNPETREIRLESAFYESFSRAAWSISLFWIIFACVKGYGGIINSILSHSYWQPLARLSYSIYLIHLYLQYILARSEKNIQYFSDWENIRLFWSDFGLSATISIFWVLAFELPIMTIEAFIFRSRMLYHNIFMRILFKKFYFIYLYFFR